MKRLFVLTALALLLTTPNAFAEEAKGGPKGKMFEKHDTNGDGSISKAEFLSHAEERFAKMDSNGDASISKEEAKAGKKARIEKMKERRANKQNGSSETE